MPLFTRIAKSAVIPQKTLLFIIAVFACIAPVHASTFTDSFDTTNFVQSSSGLYHLSGGMYTLDVQEASPHIYPVRTSMVFSRDEIVKGTTYSGFVFPENKGTLEFWVKGDFSLSGIQNVIDGYDDTRDHIFLRTYDLATGMNAQIAAQKAASSDYPFVVNFLIPNNVWNFIVITWDTVASSMSVYLNGVLVQHGVLSDAKWKPSGEMFRWDNDFLGQLSYVRVLNTPLSINDVRTDYRSTYLNSGTLVSQSVEPVSLSGWQNIVFDAHVPENTGLRVSVEYEHEGLWGIIPENDLPGNAQGFSVSPVNIKNLSSTTYQKIRLKGTLSSSGVSTPELLSWGAHWTGSLHAHPRLYLDAPKIALIKSRIATNTEPYKSRWGAIRSLADAYAAETPPAYGVESVFGADVNDTIRALGNKLPFMALAYVLTDDRKYLQGTKKWLNAIASYPKWGSDDLSPDIGNAHLLYNMAIAYDWLYNALTPEERSLYEKTLEKQSNIMTDAMEQRNPVWWVTSYNQNHNFVNVGSVMTAAVATYDTMENADHAIRLAYDNFTKVLSFLSTDAASHEGLSYWEYGIEAMLRYFDIEKNVFGTDRMLLSPWFQNAHLFRLYTSLPDYWHHVLYGDAVEIPWYGPAFTLYYLASEFHNPLAQWLANTIDAKQKSGGDSADNDWRTLLWYDESISETSPKELPTYKLFDNLGLFTSRSGWSDDDAIEFAFKAWPPTGHSLMESPESGLGHVHPDEGAFTLDGFGKSLIIDDGYSYLKRTSNHNVVTFDGSGQLWEWSVWFDGAGSGTAHIIHTDLDNRQWYEYLIADLTRIYQPTLGITKYLRHYIFLKKKTLVLIDEIESNRDHGIEWRLHMNDDSVFSLSGRTLSGMLNATDIGLVVDDVSEEAHTYSLEKETIKSTNSVSSMAFHTNTFQIKKTGKQARVESVIRPFRKTPPPALQVSRKDGYLIVGLDDASFAAVSTADRKVSMGTYPNNIPPITPVTPPLGGGWGGGISPSPMDSCPTGDTSGSYYDGKCTAPPTASTGAATPPTGTGTTTDRNRIVPPSVPVTLPSEPLLFQDIGDSWAKPYIEQLAKSGAINNTDRFHPENDITRAEFLKMTLRWLGTPIDERIMTSPFSDVTEPWQIPLVAKAKSLGIISGQTANGKRVFRPNDAITRAEAMKVLLFAAGFTSNMRHTDFTDITEPWQIPFIAKAKSLGIISGQTVNGKLVFRPNDAITRAESAKIIVKTRDIKK